MKKDPVKALKAELTGKLHMDPVKNPVAIRLENGAIVMEGFVEGISQKKRALLCAMGLEGVEGVVDRLRVRPSAVMTDKEIKKHLDDLIAGEPALKGLGIKAEVRDGVIDLEGEAPSLTHKRLAGVLAWWVPGSTDVINSLELNTLEEDTDSELADAVLSALEKDVLVGGYSITVNAKGFAVTLEGSVCSEAEKEAAEDDAWYVWGVNEVVNRLAVRRTLACRTPKRPAAG